MTYYVHKVPGRMRVRIPVIRSNPRKASEIEKLLNLHGVDMVKINHVTGSVVVTYDPETLDSESVLNLLSRKGFYDAAKAIDCEEDIQKKVNAAADKAGRYFFGWVVSKALESSGLSLLAAFI